MSPFIKIMAGVAIGSFVALILLSQVGRVLNIAAADRNQSTAATVIKLTAFGLFLGLAFSLVPLLLHVFLIGQGKIGNGELALDPFLARARMSAWPALLGRVHRRPAGRVAGDVDGFLRL